VKKIIRFFTQLLYYKEKVGSQGGYIFQYHSKQSLPAHDISTDTRIPSANAIRISTRRMSLMNSLTDKKFFTRFSFFITLRVILGF
jgi:hypothetical protein